MTYRFLFAALPLLLVPLLILGGVSDPCESDGPSSSLSECADSDDSILLQRMVSTPAVVLKEQAPDAHPTAVTAASHQSEKLHGIASTGGKTIGVPLAVADPGLDNWDTSDTILVVGMIVVLILFDVIFAPKCSYGLYNHVLSLLFMMFASAIYCAFVWKQRGQADGLAWLTGYIVEWALSMDNLFVFHLVFKSFSVPNEQSIKALRIGIYGALAFRVVFIVGLTALFSLHYMVDVVVGIVLIASGLMTLSDDDEDEVQNLGTVRFFKWLLGERLQDTYDDQGRLFIRSKSGEIQLTVLFLVVCVIAVVDCVFAVDSVGSKTGQIKNIYINLTSSLMAMFSLRSLFFIIRDMAEYFEYVKYGICAILCFVGGEMIISKWYPVPLGYMCLVIFMIFTLSVAFSVLKVVWESQKGDKQSDVPEETPGKDAPKA